MRFKELVKNVVQKILTPPVEKVKEEPPACTVKQKKEHKTVPAPVVISEDSWFSKPIKSEKAIEYETVKLMEDQKKKEEFESGPKKEPDNIHEVLYNMATKSQKTTLHIDPPGGSENFQSGPGGWNSGNGMNQFRT
jgi:hypothetical protein